MPPPDLLIGERSVVRLVSGDDVGLVRATVAPGRGMLLLQAVRRDAAGAEHDLLQAPSLAEAARRLDNGPDDFAGNAAFSFGGAILLPYANRVRGRPRPGRVIEADLGGRTARLPMNWGGKAPGAERYAMHGLILDLAFDEVRQPSPDTVTATVRNHDFQGRWPSRADITVTWRLAGGGLDLDVAVVNVGPEAMPIGIGWHPYFRLPSGRRDQACLRIPARQRAGVNNYDEVLPTGERVGVAGTAYDFTSHRPLGSLYLDDCFTDLTPSSDGMVAELTDPLGDLTIRLFAQSPPVHAVQVYAPLDQPFVCVEPQFNLADPFGAVWPEGLDTGMQRLEPLGRTAYRVRVTAGPA